MKKKTMKALVYHGPKKFSLQEVPVPRIQDPEDAIVKVTLSTICGSDLHIVEGYVPAAGPGMIVGHEFVGEIVEVGSAINARTLKPGDRVAAACSVSCGECFFCKRGDTAHCEKQVGYFGCRQDLDGCQAEYIRVPHAASVLYKIPDSLSDEDALFVGDILSTGYFGALNGGIKHGDTVAVMGCGPVAMCAMASARLLGPGTIIAVDTVDSRLQTALDNGICDIVLNPLRDDVVARIKELTEGRGADVTIEAAGAVPTNDMAIQSVRAGGTVSSIGFTAHPYDIPINDLWMRNITFKSGCVNTNHIPELLTLIEKGKINLKFLATHRKPLNEIMEGYRVFGEKEDGCIKWLVTPCEENAAAESIPA